jgi:hypothetical protein
MEGFQMKEVLAFINQKQQEFAQLPLFEFLRDKSIDSRQRLNFGPSFAIFAMNFRDLNSYILREENPSDEIQEMINRHTQEDDSHWKWLLEDFEKLGFNRSLKFNDALTFLWGEQTQISRQHFYQLAQLISQASSVMRLVIVEAIEATGNVFFGVLTEVTQELQHTTGKNYRYYGKCHLTVETGHAIGTFDVEQFLENITLTEEMRQEAFELVEKVFAGFSALLNEYLEHARAHVHSGNTYSTLLTVV